jgi:hypothetical protein
MNNKATDITNLVATAIISLVTAVVFYAFQLGKDDTESSTPFYTPTQKITQNKIAKTVCNNHVAMHEAAHYVVYMYLCKKYNETPEPQKLTIIPFGNSGGGFYFSADKGYKIQLYTDLAGYAAQELIFETPTLKDVKANYLHVKESDIYKAWKICVYYRLSFNEEFEKTKSLVKALEFDINQMALRLTKEKVIYF